MDCEDENSFSSKVHKTCQARYDTLHIYDSIHKRKTKIDESTLYYELKILRIWGLRAYYERAFQILRAWGVDTEMSCQAHEEEIVPADVCDDLIAKGFPKTSKKLRKRQKKPSMRYCGCGRKLQRYKNLCPDCRKWHQILSYRKHNKRKKEKRDQAKLDRQ